MLMIIKKHIRTRIVDFLIKKEGIASRNAIRVATPYATADERNLAIQNLLEFNVISVLYKQGPRRTKTVYKLLRMPKVLHNDNSPSPQRREED